MMRSPLWTGNGSVEWAGGDKTLNSCLRILASNAISDKKKKRETNLVLLCLTFRSEWKLWHIYIVSHSLKFSFTQTVNKISTKFHIREIVYNHSGQITLVRPRNETQRTSTECMDGKQEERTKPQLQESSIRGCWKK